jgi:uncharacterized membrane protein YtjA (UPF0391 family)
MLQLGTRFSKAKILSQISAGMPSLRALGQQSKHRLRSLMLERVPSPAVRSASHGTARRLEERAMTLLKWALIFFLVSIVAGVFGFTGISAASADVARFLFYVFVVIFLVLLVLGLTIFRV